MKGRFRVSSYNGIRLEQISDFVFCCRMEVLLKTNLFVVAAE